MTNVLIAGAKEPLRSYLLKELADWDIPATFLSPLSASLKNVCEGIETVISVSTFSADAGEVEANDKTNLQLLQEARRAGVQRFIYVLKKGNKERYGLPKAEERFVGQLRSSGLAYTIIWVNSFFGEVKSILSMAECGPVFLFGNGEQKLHPIHEADLAEVCIKAGAQQEKELHVGGPDILTHNEIAEMALSACNKPPDIIHLPGWMQPLLLRSANMFWAGGKYNQLKNFLSLIATENSSTRYGERRLQDFFNQEVQLTKQP